MFGGRLILRNLETTWVVLIVCRLDQHTGKMCTGNVIHPHWVVTAAHCLMNGKKILEPRQVTVKVYLGIDHFQTFSVEKVFPHPKYLNKSSEDEEAFADVGLIKTHEVLGIRVARIHNDSNYYPNESCFTAGFGRKGVEVEKTPTLHQMEMKLLPEYGCRLFSSTSMCFLLLGGIGPCIGDSGAPLFCSGRLIAILSSGQLQGKPVCGATDGILFYEPLAQYRNWIEAVQKANSAQRQDIASSMLPLLVILSWIHS